MNFYSLKNDIISILELKFIVYTFVFSHNFLMKLENLRDKFQIY